MRAILAVLAISLVPPSVMAAEPAPMGGAAPLERIRALAEQWKAGGLSAAEKDELLRVLTLQVLGVPAVAEAATAPPAAGSSGKVIAVYRDRNTTKSVLQTTHPLVPGSRVYLGPAEVPATLHELLSRSGELYYYFASTPGYPNVPDGGAVLTERTRVLETPSALRLKISEVYTFEGKRLGEVTAVQDGRAMIDRGTLHEVRERDLYAVYDSSSRRKGFIEIRGIGDLQSSGVLYNRIEDSHKRALNTGPGDRVVFLGQRKLFGLGGFYGTSLGGAEEFGAGESAFGAGLAWNIMFKNGWGFEVLFGTYERRLSGMGTVIQSIGPGPRNVAFTQEVAWKASYLFPVAVKKNFLYPSVVSPFALAGGAMLRAKLEKKIAVVDPTGPLSRGESIDGSVETFSPMLGCGVEFFPARLIHPRLDLRWFYGPTVRAQDKSMRTEHAFFSASIFSAW